MKLMAYSQNQLARLSGFFYLLVVIMGKMSLIDVPSQIIDWGNASSTIEAIRSNELLFRLGMVGWF
jgi:hypothetical protein